MNKYLNNPELLTMHPHFKGNRYADGKFMEDGMTVDASFRKFLRWQLTTNPQKQEKKQDDYKPDLKRGRSFLHGTDDVLVWLGHASFFIRLNGVNIITDPCLTDLPFLKRSVGLPCALQELIGIDYMLLSHDHRDHLDHSSVRQLVRNNPGMELLLPLKISELLEQSIRNRSAFQEAGWWQQYKVAGLEIFFLPARHWNRRGLFDFNRNLWGSFLLKTDKRSVYFAGDSGYAPHFREIREVLGKPDVCLMPVGAYRPSFLMQEAHMSPEEAVTAFHELQGKTFIPMHYGTYDLSDEPPGEPVRVLRQYEKRQKIKGSLMIPAVGELVGLS